MNEADLLLSPPGGKIKKDQEVNSSKIENARELLEDYVGFKEGLHQMSIFQKFVGTKSGGVGLFFLLISILCGYKGKSCYFDYLF